ncbi:MAG: hypothetical protein ACJ76I_11085 [Gaiellaceae bacterium]
MLRIVSSETRRSTMGRKLTAIVALAAMAVTLAAVAAAGPVAAKQRVEIQEKGQASFVLAPLTAGAIKRDTGSASFCCWTQRHIVRDGQDVDINDPQMTLTLKRGTLVVRNRIGFVDIPDGWAVFTGTWKVIRGTGDYAGLSGGGRRAGVMLPNGSVKSQFEGFLSPK